MSSKLGPDHPRKSKGKTTRKKFVPPFHLKTNHIIQTNPLMKTPLKPQPPELALKTEKLLIIWNLPWIPKVPPKVSLQRMMEYSRPTLIQLSESIPKNYFLCIHFFRFGQNTDHMIQQLRQSIFSSVCEWNIYIQLRTTAIYSPPEFNSNQGIVLLWKFGSRIWDEKVINLHLCCRSSLSSQE